MQDLHLRVNTTRRHKGNGTTNTSNNSSSSSSNNNSNNNTPVTNYLPNSPRNLRKESLRHVVQRKNKENRIIMYQKIGGLAVVIVVLFLTASRLFFTAFGGYFSSSNNNSSNSNSRITGSHRFNKGGHKQIIEKYLTPIMIQITSSALTEEPGKTRYGTVHMTFCEIDWSVQARDASSVPMFRDLERASGRCIPTKAQTIDFYRLVQEAKAYDGFVDHGSDHYLNNRKSAANSVGIDESSNNGNNGNNANDNYGGIFPPEGAIFHETRCGSTLIANLMVAGFDRGKSRVYSESPVPIRAIKACGGGSPTGGTTNCDDHLHKQLIRDVFYMMGRRPPLEDGDTKPNHLFFKFQSTSSFSIDRFAMAFPEVPWVFTFRNTVEIVISHMQTPTGGMRTEPSRICTKFRHLYPFQQPSTTVKAIEAASPKISLADMTMTQYCAAHLAGLSLAALEEHDRQRSSESEQHHPGGTFVNYHQLPDIVWNEIIPNHFGISQNEQPLNIENMRIASGTYSKGRGNKLGEKWEEDADAKKQAAPPKVQRAADQFTSDIYQRMEAISQEMASAASASAAA